jgi:hypothetical protein
MVRDLYVKASYKKFTKRIQLNLRALSIMQKNSLSLPSELGTVMITLLPSTYGMLALLVGRFWQSCAIGSG